MYSFSPRGYMSLSDTLYVFVNVRSPAPRSRDGYDSVLVWGVLLEVEEEFPLGVFRSFLGSLGTGRIRVPRYCLRTGCPPLSVFSQVGSLLSVVDTVRGVKVFLSRRRNTSLLRPWPVKGPLVADFPRSWTPLWSSIIGKGRW